MFSCLFMCLLTIITCARSLHLAKLYVFNYFILIVISPSFKVDSHIINIRNCLDFLLNLILFWFSPEQMTSNFTKMKEKLLC